MIVRTLSIGKEQVQTHLAAEMQKDVAALEHSNGTEETIRSMKLALDAVLQGAFTSEVEQTDDSQATIRYAINDGEISMTGITAMDLQASDVDYVSPVYS